MYITFPIDDDKKLRLNAICKALGITLDQWFQRAIAESEYDALVESLPGKSNRVRWEYDQDQQEFIPRRDA